VQPLPNRAWTQEQLAAVSNLDVRTIQRVEKDRTRNPETLQAIAGAFNVDLAALRTTWRIPESRLLRTELITSYRQFVQSEEAHHSHVAVQVTMVPLKEEFEAQINDLWDKVFVDRDAISPNDPDLWPWYVEAVRQPLTDLFGFGFAIFVIDERKDLILPQTGDLKPVKDYIDDWRVRHFRLIPRHGCFQLDSDAQMHRFNPECSAAGDVLLGLSKSRAGSIVYMNAMPAVIQSGGEKSIQWCDKCFPKSADGIRIGFEYIQ
jgi:transcriptional regulator with XRE-family HTH domain